MSTTTIAFIYQWQTLIGAFLGPFLAIILSGIGFWIRFKYLSWKDKNETVRMSEVSITRTLNDLYMTRKKLEDFVRRLRKLASDIHNINDDHTYSLEFTNFPAARDVFFNSDLIKKKFGSPYLHNQTLFGDANIGEINSWLAELKANFSTLIENNRFVVTLTPKPTPRHQRGSYADDLNGFADAVESFLAYIKIVIKGTTQIKVYSQRLMKHRILTILKNESSTFRYFRNAEEREKYKEWETLLDRVDKVIQKEVDDSLAKAEERYTR